MLLSHETLSDETLSEEGSGDLLSTEGVYSRDMGRGNSREGGERGGGGVKCVNRGGEEPDACCYSRGTRRENGSGGGGAHVTLMANHPLCRWFASTPTAS
jgi:hypothetical protein